MNKKTNFLGTIDINQDVIYVTDPCYSHDIWCRYNIVNMEHGKYLVFQIMDVGENRVAEISIVKNGISLLDWKLYEGVTIGVDSGQAGFFFRPELNDEKKDGVYDQLFEAIYYNGPGSKPGSGPQTAITPWGVNSLTGYGDGGYDLYRMEVDGRVVALKLVFISEEEEEEVDWDDDEEDV